MTHGAEALPVEAVFGPLRKALAGAGRAVLSAPPGSGKTTAVPLALLDAPWLAGRRILVLEPRRVAARAAARRMAFMLGEALGERVGYRTRFDTRVGAGTRIELLTEGVLSAWLQRDPGLDGVGLVVFDEFHERSLHANLALALCLDAAAALREDLRVLVMSATLDAAGVARLLGGAPVLRAHGQAHPVAVQWGRRPPPGDLARAVAAGVREMLDSGPGDVLAFLPGAREIRDTAGALAGLAREGVAEMMPLHGGLPGAAQDRAVQGTGRGRRVVLATPIAETSLTLSGVRAVVDAGLVRVPRYHPGSGLTRLETVRISRASATQRAGRAGREAPGRCLRLWSETEHQGLVEHAGAEILEADLAPLALELARWGEGEPARLAWLDPPPAAALAAAHDLLASLQAMDGHGRITSLGREMAALPTHPRLARMLVGARGAPERALACDLAALLGERDPLRGTAGRGADLEPRLRALAAFRSGGAGASGADGMDAGVLDRVRHAARGLGRALARRAPGAGAPAPDDEPAGRLLALAYPDRVAQLRPGARSRYRLSGGRGARLGEADPLAGSPWLVAAELDGAGADARILRAARIGEAALRECLAARLGTHREVLWDARAGAVRAQQSLRLGALVIESRELDTPDPRACLAALLEGVRAAGSAALPWRPPARALQARVASMRIWRPDEGWPEFGDEALMRDLEAWLGPWVAGMRRLRDLAGLDLAAILRARLDWRLQQRLDEGAPERLRVPSGASHRLEYRPGEAPVLAVRVQELYGSGRTPSVCWGEVPVLLHLLSPARRPVQITRDLAGFWSGSWRAVRGEMRSRYPKHDWPEDPLNSPAHAGRTRRRGDG